MRLAPFQIYRMVMTPVRDYDYLAAPHLVH